MRVAHALLGGAVDYAGLFPPSSHDLDTTVREYEEYREGADAWALGRLILPAGCLAGYTSKRLASATRWPVSLLLGPEWENDLRLAAQLGVRAETVEFRLTEIAQVAALASALPAECALFFEVGFGGDAPAYLEAIAAAGGYAKVRTGGVTAGAIPSSADLLRFLEACRRCGLAFKATAGLHHALRGVHPLTYAADSARAPMHGFVNLMLAAAIVFAGGEAERAEELLEENVSENFTMADDGVRWRDQRFSTRLLMRVRERFMLSFGSCSFTEPIAELRTMRWL